MYIASITMLESTMFYNQKDTCQMCCQCRDLTTEFSDQIPVSILRIHGARLVPSTSATT